MWPVIDQPQLKGRFAKTISAQGARSPGAIEPPSKPRDCRSCGQSAKRRHSHRRFIPSRGRKTSQKNVTTTLERPKTGLFAPTGHAAVKTSQQWPTRAGKAFRTTVWPILSCRQLSRNSRATRGELPHCLLWVLSPAWRTLLLAGTALQPSRKTLLFAHRRCHAGNLGADATRPLANHQQSPGPAI